MKNTEALEESAHVVRSDETLDAVWVIDQVTEALTEIGGWISNAQTHERTALCLWEGQSEDGRKWARNYGRKVFPFEGAADSRVHLTGAAVDELTMLEMMAVDAAKVQVIAMEANDGAASKRVETLMKYETRQRMRGELWRERNFARQIKHTFGHAVMHVGWEQRMGTKRATVTVDDLVKLATEMELAAMRQAAVARGAQADRQGEVLTPEEKLTIADVAETRVEGMLATEDGDVTELVGLIRLRHGLLSPTRARKVARALQRAEAGEVIDFAEPIRKPGRPSVRAMLPGFDVFYPWWTCVAAEAPWIARVDSYSEPELRAMPKKAGWDAKAVAALLALGPTQVVDSGVVQQALQRVSHTMFNEPARLTTAQRLASKQSGAYEVLHITVQTVDEEGYPAVQEIILHPGLCGSEKRKHGNEHVLLNRLVDYYFDGGCYVDLRREFKPARPLWEARGVPELTGTHQSLVKGGRDASMDRTSFVTMPIVKVNARRAGGGERWDYEPGTKLPLAQGEVAEYMQAPRLDQGMILDAAEIRKDAANLLGLHHAEVPQAKTLMHQQWIVTNALLEEREVLLRILGLDQQFMEPLFVSRVIGAGPAAFQVTREEIAGSFDFVLEFDVKSLDMEYLQKRWTALKDAFSIPGVAGQVPTVPLVSWLLNNIDAGLADLVTGGLQERNAAQGEEEKAAVAMMLAGVEPAVTESMDAQTRLGVLEEQMKVNPVVQQAYAAGGLFAEMMNGRAEAFRFQIRQRTENAQTGRTGFKPVMDAGRP